MHNSTHSSQMNTMRIDTPAGLVVARSAPEGVEIGMGPPSFEPADLPADPARMDSAGAEGLERVVGGVRGVLVSVGNPHLVCFVDGSDQPPALEQIGPALQRHPAFPQGVNVHTARVLARDLVQIRSWERGVGPTTACGTGACAVFAAGVRTERLGDAVTVRAPGGDLAVRRDPRDGALLLRGPAEIGASGVWWAPER